MAGHNGSCDPTGTGRCLRFQGRPKALGTIGFVVPTSLEGEGTCNPNHKEGAGDDELCSVRTPGGRRVAEGLGAARPPEQLGWSGSLGRAAPHAAPHLPGTRHAGVIHPNGGHAPAGPAVAMGTQPPARLARSEWSLAVPLKEQPSPPGLSFPLVVALLRPLRAGGELRRLGNAPGKTISRK